MEYNRFLQFNPNAAFREVCGYPNTTVRVHFDSSSYMNSRIAGVCKITSHSINIFSGDNNDIHLDISSGEVAVTIWPQTFKFEITACAKNLVSSVQCKTTD